MYILLVDADPQHAESAIAVLTTDGFGVRHSSSAASALLAVRQECPALIILNLELPDISGQTLALRLKHELGRNTPPIVAVTAYDVSSYRQSARQAGCETVLAKPVSPHQWVETARHYLGQLSLSA